MEQEKREGGAIESHMTVHLVFATRYKRRVFASEEVVKAFLGSVRDTADALGCRLLTSDCREGVAHLHMECSPNISPAHLQMKIKKDSAPVIRQAGHIAEDGRIWTRGCLIATADRYTLDMERRYIAELKTRC